MQAYSREIKFEQILNFRDLGGYETGDSQKVAWRQLFRSSELHCMTSNDITKLQEEIKVKTVIDLRSLKNITLLGNGRLNEIGAKYHSIPLGVVEESYAGGTKEPDGFSNSGELYLYRLRDLQFGKQIVKVLKIIADDNNYPLVFHCNGGKDRTGIMSAMVLDILGVAETDIISDYILTNQDRDAFINRWNNDPRTSVVHKNLPEYSLRVDAKSMEVFLSGIRKEFGSTGKYMESVGAETSLVNQLRQSLLE